MKATGYRSRYVLLTRLKEAPHPFIANLHLTTLVGERPPDMIPRKREQAHLMRFQQISRFLDLVHTHILEKNEPLIVAGDFNATEDEAGIRHLLDAHPELMRLRPENDGPTHPDLRRAVDHIFFFPARAWWTIPAGSEPATSVGGHQITFRWSLSYRSGKPTFNFCCANPFGSAMQRE